MRVTKAANKVAVSPAQAAVQLSLRTTDFVSMADLSPRETATVLDLAALLKAKPKEFRDALTGKQLVLIFEKPSLRTRVTFEAGMAALGGTSLFMDQRGSRISSREEVRDVARNLERWVDGIVLRTYDHATITEMAEHAAIPVVNALSDLEHPCQALADFLTLQEKFGDLRSVNLSYVGDGNNVAHSLMLAAALLGSSITVATPVGFEPNLQIALKANEIARKTGAHIELSHDPVEAVCGADAVYTDVWASMGQEVEAESRRAVFAPFQVNEKVLAHAAPHAIFMHCLPAPRGDEVTAGVIDSPRAVVFDQAENRLHVQKAILMLLLGDASRFPARSAHA